MLGHRPLSGQQRHFDGPALEEGAGELVYVVQDARRVERRHARAVVAGANFHVGVELPEVDQVFGGEVYRLVAELPLEPG